MPAYIRPNVSAARPDASQYSISIWFLSKFQEREDQSTVRTSNSYGPDVHSSKKEIADSTSTFRKRALQIWKLRVEE
jgi:hypothetical protein